MPNRAITGWTADEQWTAIKLFDGSVIRVKTVVVAVVQPLDDAGEALLDDFGNPRYLVTTQVILAPVTPASVERKQ